MNTRFFLIVLVQIVLSGVLSGQKNQEIILSSRWFHPRSPEDSLDTKLAIELFKPDRIDWTYSADSSSLNYFRSHGLKFSLTINPMIPDSFGFTSVKNRIRTLNGDLYVAPWMRNWKIKTPYWGCVNNPEFKKSFYDRSRELLKTGAYGLMVDNSEFNLRLIKDNLYGCFCEHCVQKFIDSNYVFWLPRSLFLKNFKLESKKQHSKLIMAYADFQKKSVINFLADWKKLILNEYVSTVFLTNNYNGSWEQPYSIFDGGIAELNEQLITDSTLSRLYTESDRLGKYQLFCTNSAKPEAHYKLVRYAVKNRRDILIPWDVFVLNSNKRYYIKPYEFNNLLNED